MAPRKARRDTRAVMDCLPSCSMRGRGRPAFVCVTRSSKKGTHGRYTHGPYPFASGYVWPNEMIHWTGAAPRGLRKSALRARYRVRRSCCHSVEPDRELVRLERLPRRLVARKVDLEVY